jgi:uncharacterized protein
MKRPLHWILAGLTVLLAATGFAEDEKNKPIKALLITGGCCHDYEFQSKALTLAHSRQLKHPRVV